MILNGAVDLGEIASCGARLARARALLAGIVGAARQAVDADGPVVAFSVVSAGNEDLDAEELRDALALAAVLMAAAHKEGRP